jgi:AcrR family transcriptional regulator
MAADRTPKERLTRERVLEAAMAFAQREGNIEALSMRKLADGLGTSAMALYYYVPNKEALIDAMIDLVFAEIEVPSFEDEWRVALRRRAVSTRAVLRRHRWAVGLMEARATPGPHILRMHNAILGCLRRAGFSIEATIQAMSVQDAYIYGFALQEKALPEDIAAAAQRQVSQHELSALEQQFPHLAEVVAGHVTQVGYDFTATFEYGLDLILDGLAGSLTVNGGARPVRRPRTPSKPAGARSRTPSD